MEILSGRWRRGGVAAFHHAFRDFFFEVRRVATPVSVERPVHGEDLEELLDRDGDRVAAVIVEPMLQGAGGMLVHPPAFLQRVRELTRPTSGAAHRG